MNKILVLKNDRVGDLANSLKGINSLLNENRNQQIEIILSDVSKDLSFLFKIKNVKITYFNYSLNIFDKVKLFFKVVTSNFEKIYILAPKNIYFFLPLICRSKFLQLQLLIKINLDLLNILGQNCITIKIIIERIEKWAKVFQI